MLHHYCTFGNSTSVAIQTLLIVMYMIKYDKFLSVAAFIASKNFTNKQYVPHGDSHRVLLTCFKILM